MATARDICTQALKKAGITGVGQTPLAEDINDAFTDLNDMIAEWAAQRWLVYRLTTLSTPSTGAQTYSVGPLGDMDISVTPPAVESAYFRQITQSSPNQVDFPLSIIEAREDYNLISLKKLQTWPQYVYYEHTLPLGTLYVWPVPQSGQFTIFASFKHVLAAFANLSETVSFPAYYEAALKFNLAVRLMASYQDLPTNPYVVAIAKKSLNTIRTANSQIARRRIPAVLARPGLYNVFSDQLY